MKFGEEYHIILKMSDELWYQWIALREKYDLIAAIEDTPVPPDAPVVPVPGGAGAGEGAGGVAGDSARGTGGGGAALVAALAGPLVRTSSERWDLKNTARVYMYLLMYTDGGVVAKQLQSSDMLVRAAIEGPMEDPKSLQEKAMPLISMSDSDEWHGRRSGDRGQRIEENKNAEKEHRGEFRPGMRYHGHMNFSGAAAKLRYAGAVPVRKPMMRSLMRGAEGREIEYGPGEGPGPVVEVPEKVPAVEPAMVVEEPTEGAEPVGVVMQDAYPKDWVPGLTPLVIEAFSGPEECDLGYGDVSQGAMEIKNARTFEPFDRGKALAQDRREMIRSAMRVVGRRSRVMLVYSYYYGLGRPKGASVIEQYRMSETVGDRMEDLPQDWQGAYAV